MEVKSDAQVQERELRPREEIFFTRGVWGQCVLLKFFHTSGIVRNQSS